MSETKSRLILDIISMIKSNPQLILDIMKAKEYKTYKGLLNVNNFGIRVETEGGDFDDIIGTVFEDTDNMTGETFLNCLAFVATTDPGVHYLKKPINEDGCAILVPGQYFNFQIEKHRGQYDALCQRGIVKVFRDNNKDEIIDLNPESVESGMFGINIHKTPPYLETEMVNKNSAGCQVLYNSAEYDSEWMPLMYRARTSWGKNFTYTLLELSDIAGALKTMKESK